MDIERTVPDLTARCEAKKKRQGAALPIELDLGGDSAKRFAWTAHASYPPKARKDPTKSTASALGREAETKSLSNRMLS